MENSKRDKNKFIRTQDAGCEVGWIYYSAESCGVGTLVGLRKKK